MHHFLHALGFGLRDLASECGELVGSAPLVIRAGLDDQLVIEESLDQAVEGAGAEANPSGGPLLDVLENQVAVLRPVGERQQDMEGRRGQGKIGCRITLDRGHVCA